MQSVVPDGFEIANISGQRRVFNLITSSGRLDFTDHTVDTVEGFEDVIGGVLGSGNIYNHSTSIYQLAFAIAVVAHPLTAELLQDPVYKEKPAAAVKRLRDEHVLDGQRIIDLGCGEPNFGLAAKALGAKVFTADVQDIGPGYASRLDGHIVVDLGEDSAADKLLQATGGGLDIVTENIIGDVYGQTVPLPSADSIVTIGKVLLETKGYLYRPHDRLLQSLKKS